MPTAGLLCHDIKTGIPESIWQSDDALVAAASMLCEYHKATSTYVAPEPSNWLMPYADASRHEVICHNDFAPYNIVFNNGIPTGLIDFDLASPGPAIRDVAYAVYWFVPLSFTPGNMHSYSLSDIENNNRRLKLFCNHYGCKADTALLYMVFEVLMLMGNERVMKAMLGDAVAQKLIDEGHTRHWRLEAAGLRENMDQISANFQAES